MTHVEIGIWIMAWKSDVKQYRDPTELSVEHPFRAALLRTIARLRTVQWEMGFHAESCCRMCFVSRPLSSCGYESVDVWMYVAPTFIHPYFQTYVHQRSLRSWYQMLPSR